MNDAELVKDILDSHPALARQTVVNNLYAIVIMTFGLCTRLKRNGTYHDVQSKFIQEWLKYVPAIISYAEISFKRNLCKYLVNLNTEGILQACMLILHS